MKIWQWLLTDIILGIILSCVSLEFSVPFPCNIEWALGVILISKFLILIWRLLDEIYYNLYGKTTNLTALIAKCKAYFK